MEFSDKNVIIKCKNRNSASLPALRRLKAAMKPLKSHLYKSLGNAALIFEELNIYLVRIEVILNYRSLAPISFDSSDMSVLIPGHFLIGNFPCALPERDETAIPTEIIFRGEEE